MWPCSSPMLPEGHAPGAQPSPTAAWEILGVHGVPHRRGMNLPRMPQGFLRAYDSVRARVLGIAGEVLKEDAHAWRVCVTGHSLGGALATLCAYELANRRHAPFTAACGLGNATPLKAAEAAQRTHTILRQRCCRFGPAGGAAAHALSLCALQVLRRGEAAADNVQLRVAARRQRGLRPRVQCGGAGQLARDQQARCNPSRPAPAGLLPRRQQRLHHPRRRLRAQWCAIRFYLRCISKWHPLHNELSATCQAMVCLLLLWSVTQDVTAVWYV